MTDDQGWGDFSLHGNDSISTPNIDQFAREGIQFDRFNVSPVCAPTRASLLTGRYHLRTGTSWVTHRKEVMREDEFTIAEALKEVGYKTGIFGKWHNGSQYPHHPNGQGFDNFFGFASGHWNNYFDTGLEYNGKEVKTKGYITDVLTDKAIDFIKTNRENPFFCYVPYNAPHGPFQVPDKYFDKYKAMGLSDKNAAVYGMNENIDDNFQRLLDALDQAEIRENTIVIFLTDNGPNGRRYNGGMRGTKASVHEGGVRVPLFIQWPAQFKKPLEIKPIASHIDLMPTILELCGIDEPENIKFDGVSLRPLIFEQEVVWPDREIYSIQNDGKQQNFPSSVRTDQYRLVKDRNQSIGLYNMISDPGQQNEISSQFPEITKGLQNKLENWYIDVSSEGTTPPLIEIGHPESPKIALPAPEALFQGGIEFKGRMGWSNDWIINWNFSDDVATWQVKVVDSGKYLVRVLYAIQMDGPSISINYSDQTVSKQITKSYFPSYLKSPDRIPRGEVYEREWAKLDVGVFDLNIGTEIIKLSTQDDHRNSGLEIKGVEIEKL